MVSERLLRERERESERNVCPIFLSPGCPSFGQRMKFGLLPVTLFVNNPSSPKQREEEEEEEGREREKERRGRERKREEEGREREKKVLTILKLFLLLF